MYQREFDQRLKQAFPKAVLLYGENDYLVDHYIDTYIKIRRERVYAFTLP